MLATGGSALKAVEVLTEHGVSPDNVIFVNVISSPGMSTSILPINICTHILAEGLRTFCGAYPNVSFCQTVEMIAMLNGD